MIREISVEELQNLDCPILIDVRSEGEFSEATIPGAINLPLLNNFERNEVGKIFTQVSPYLARQVGLSFVSPKLPLLFEKATELAKLGPLVLFCWRGGMRSRSLAGVLDLMGMTIYRLQGGYKSYRKRVVEYFQAQLPFQVVVIRGNTGVGKTELLGRLRQDGYPAIDLEKLANNRGSVFGAMGLGEPPSQKTFEALLYEEMRSFAHFTYVIVECESKRIGRVTLPVQFYEAMQKGTQVLLFDEVANRVQRLLDVYIAVPDAQRQIHQALERLIKTLGHEKVEDLRELLEYEHFYEFTEKLLMEYYDPLYAYPNSPTKDYQLCLNHKNRDLTLKEMEDYLDKRVPQQGR